MKAQENYAFIGLSEGSIHRLVVPFDTLIARVVKHKVSISKQKVSICLSYKASESGLMIRHMNTSC